MDRSVYGSADAAQRGWYEEISTNDSGFYSSVVNGGRHPMHPYHWYRIDINDPFVLTYDGMRHNQDAFGFHSLRDAAIRGTVSALGAETPCERISAVQAEVRNHLLTKVRNREIDLGVSLGEYRETASLISSAMRKAAVGYRQLRRGDISGMLRTLTGRSNRNWRDIPGAAANTWLAYTYGVKPLIQDAYAAASLYERRYQPYPEVSVARASKTVTISGSASRPSLYENSVQGVLRVRGKISFRTTNPVLRKLDQVGVVNPLSVAWELVPFSFVVDWFIPVGEFITNIVPPQGVDFVDGYLSTRLDGTAVNKTVIPSPSVGWHTRADSRECLKVREILTTFPRYHLTVPDLSLSKGQIASGIALLTQALIR